MHHPGYVQGGQEAGFGCLLLGVYYRRIPGILGGYVAALLHERTNGEPHGVAQTELVHQNLLIII
jgi:hypothetical protein